MVQADLCTHSLLQELHVEAVALDAGALDHSAHPGRKLIQLGTDDAFHGGRHQGSNRRSLSHLDGPRQLVHGHHGVIVQPPADLVDVERNPLGFVWQEQQQRGDNQRLK